MAIVTEFSSEHSITSTYDILCEFITTYIPEEEINITDKKPKLIEGYELSKPMIWLQLYPGSEQLSGLGQSVGGGKGKFQNFAYMCNIIVSNNVGGEEKGKLLAEQLRWIFLKYSGDLVNAKLKLPVCGTYREIAPDSNNPVFGGRMLISFKVLLEF